jgi:transposase
MARTKKYPAKVGSGRCGSRWRVDRPIAQVAHWEASGDAVQEVRDAEAHGGRRSVLLSGQEPEEIRRLGKENCELKRANEILRARVPRPLRGRAATTYASALPARPDTTRTATAPPSTSSPLTASPKRPGTPPPAGSPTTSAGTDRARRPAAAPCAHSCRRSSSSATTATPATARHAPAAATVPRTSTSRGSRPAMAPAASPRPARG